MRQVVINRIQKLNNMIETVEGVWQAAFELDSKDSTNEFSRELHVIMLAASRIQDKCMKEGERLRKRV